MTRKGDSKYPYRDDQDRELIVAMIKRGTTNEDIAARTGWSPIEVRDIRAMFFPRASLAADYLRANALKLAQRVVEEANVEEAVDILSRPNIGVLEPAVKAPTGRPIGVFTTINTSTLGGVMAPTVETTVIEGETACSPTADRPPPVWPGKTDPDAASPPPSLVSRSPVPLPPVPARPLTPSPRKRPSTRSPTAKP